MLKDAKSASVIPVPATNSLVLGKLIVTTLSSDLFQKSLAVSIHTQTHTHIHTQLSG